jgi:hypothetical protein
METSIKLNLWIFFNFFSLSRFLLFALNLMFKLKIRTMWKINNHDGLGEILLLENESSKY